MKNTVVAILMVMLYGCSIGSQISGSYVSLNSTGGILPAISPAEVSIFLQPPKSKYQATALLSASATISGYSDVAAIEAELLEELRRQAASSGANGVMEIVREVMVGDKVITTNTWGMAARPRHELSSQKPPRLPPFNRQRHSVVTSDYLIIYRGQAISYEK